MPVGRPSDYDPAFCAQAIEFMGQGFSKTAFAGHIGVNPDTLYEWAKVHREFSDAIKTAVGARVKFLENRLIGETTAGPQVTAMIFALKNAMPAEWRDRHEHVGADGGPIQVTVARFTSDAES